MRPATRSLLVAAIALSLCDYRALAQTSAELFDTETIQEIRLSISTRDLQQLRERFAENTYYPADLQWHSMRVRNVGIRSRGTASRSPSKLGLQIDFDRYTGGQRFLGLKSLVLDNLLQDPAMVRERVAMAFFARMGQPAPREAFARLYVNNEFQGLYAVVEPIDSEFLKRAFGDDSGFLYEYQYLGPYYGEYLGDELSAYQPLFDPRTHQRESDTVLYSPIRDLLREVNHPDDAVWRSRVHEYLDLRQFITHVAIESFLSEEDGILGFAGMANFYLHRPADSTRHRVIPWDKDLTFRSHDTWILQRSEENVLFRRVMAFDDLRMLYMRVLVACARLAAEDDWLLNEITRAATLVAPVAYEDVRKPYSNDEFEEAVRFLRRFARWRPDYVRRDVARALRGQ